MCFECYRAWGFWSELWRPQIFTDGAVLDRAFFLQIRLQLFFQKPERSPWLLLSRWRNHITQSKAAERGPDNSKTDRMTTMMTVTTVTPTALMPSMLMTWWQLLLPEGSLAPDTRLSGPAYDTHLTQHLIWWDYRYSAFTTQFITFRRYPRSQSKCGAEFGKCPSKVE